MANKRLLSLLFLISITNLFWTNAEVTSCYFAYGPEGTQPDIKKNCARNTKEVCFKQVIKAQGKTPAVNFGCTREMYCKYDGFTCCRNDNCNKNL